jgi:hypothetical protein
LHRRAIKGAIGLGAGSAHGGPFAAVEHAELDAGRVCHPAHQPVQGIDLAHQMALAHPADGGIAGHLAQGLEGMGQQQRARAKARRRGGCLTARMTPANNDDVVAHGGSNTRRRFHPQAGRRPNGCA